MQSPLIKYLIKDDSKINPNVRKLLIKDDAQEYITNLCSKFSIPATFYTITTIQLAEVFFRDIYGAEPSHCLTCGKPTKFAGFALGRWNNFCNASCEMQHPAQQELRKEDALKRFGVPSYILNDKGREKAKLTKSTPEYKISFNRTLKTRWKESKAEIVEKIRRSKASSGKKPWKVRFSHVIDKLNDLNFEIVEEKQSGKPLLIKHAPCGAVQPYGRWNGDIYLCGICSPNTRIKSQTAFLDEVEHKLGIKLERDVRIPTENGFIKPDGLCGNIAIDFNGLFWHSQAAENAGFGVFNPNYHSARYEYLKEKGIKLIQIYQDDWLNKKEIVLLRLKHAFKLSEKIPGRKCNVKQIKMSEAKAFLKQHHLMGHVPAAVALGCFHNEKLVAVATFSQNRYGKRDKIELLRFASSAAVVGGLSKIMKHALKEFERDIISYSDNMWGSGDGYRSAGFELVTSGKVGYFYYDKKNGDRVSRHAFRKDQFEKVFGLKFDSSISEAENAKKVACFQIFDAGKSKWIMRVAS